MDELIYVAAPYTHPDPVVVEGRMRAVERHLAHLSADRKVAFSPLLMHYCLDKGVDLPGDYGFWRNHCLTLLSKSDTMHVLTLPGWEVSGGVLDEIRYAEEHGTPIKYVRPPLGTKMKIPVESLKAICNPFEDSPWGCELTRDMVRYCLDSDVLLGKPITQEDEDAEWGAVNAHAARIAYLIMKEGEVQDPISVDVGVPSLGHHVDWIIIDGNHRFAAALYMGAKYIEAEVSGQVDYAEKLLGCSPG